MGFVQAVLAASDRQRDGVLVSGRKWGKPMRVRIRAAMMLPKVRAKVEAEVRKFHKLKAGKIDWSSIDWAKLLSLVLQILASLGVL